MRGRLGGIHALTKTRRRVVVVGIAVAAGVIGAATVLASDDHAPSVPRAADAAPGQIAIIQKKALAISKANGEPAPSSVQLVATRRRAAAGLTGGSVPSDDPVFAVTLHGHFRVD